jgi:hypothetical protein
MVTHTNSNTYKMATKLILAHCPSIHVSSMGIYWVFSKYFNTKIKPQNTD